MVDVAWRRTLQLGSTQDSAKHLQPDTPLLQLHESSVLKNFNVLGDKSFDRATNDNGAAKILEVDVIPGNTHSCNNFLCVRSCYRKVVVTLELRVAFWLMWFHPWTANFRYPLRTSCRRSKDELHSSLGRFRAPTLSWRLPAPNQKFWDACSTESQWNEEHTGTPHSDMYFHLRPLLKNV